MIKIEAATRLLGAADSKGAAADIKLDIKDLKFLIANCKDKARKEVLSTRLKFKKIMLEDWK